ncbi:MAG TPA: 1-acyl-sn-glycerol-3-phosphate acyltransferase [Gemmatimonadaceae bacterium]|jgi:glycerol-3-phosphate O-acyltransferase
MLGPLRTYFDRLALRAVHRSGARVDRYKLARRSFVSEQLLNDPVIADAVRRHAAEQGIVEAEAWGVVHRYIDEIVPFFNIIAYYQLGYRAAGWLLDLFYKVSVEYADRARQEQLPRDAVLVYLMNHRSNADYVLVSYALAGDVAISYAVGEWARAFPLEHLFKAFGSYFVRRRYREALYHAVLERYVQLITRQGVTQGIFLEGGLTKDGKLRPPKIGLLDYVLGIARDPAYRSRLFIVPVAVNYDRVLEDRTLLRELATADGHPHTSKFKQLREVVHYLWWNSARLVTRRWKRYGRAAVTVGAPIALDEWFARESTLFDLPRAHRLARVQALCDEIMVRIGQLVPVTSVPLACAAIQSIDRDFIPRSLLLDRMTEMRAVLVELNGRVIRADRDITETWERAWRMLRMRRVLLETGDGYTLLPRNRELVRYYANSIAHLLGPYESAVRARDARPTGEFAAPDLAGPHGASKAP